MSVALMDFWPAYQPAMEDFYPGGFLCQKVPARKPSMGPAAAAVVIALAERLKCAAEAEVELLTIMEFCDTLLRNNGVKMRVTYERPLPETVTSSEAPASAGGNAK